MSFKATFTAETRRTVVVNTRRWKLALLLQPAADS